MGDMSGSKKTSSETKNTTNTTNIDRRQVVGEGAIGLASDNANITIQSMDAGLAASAMGAVSQTTASALGSVNMAINAMALDDATTSEGFKGLLTLADKLFSGAGEIIGKTQDTTLGQIAALSTAKNDAMGGIDQKTIMVAVGVAGAVAIAFAVGGKK